MKLKSPSKIASIALLSLLVTFTAQAFTIIAFNANGQATNATFGVAIDNPLDNYAEMQGFVLDGDWELEDVQQVGFSMCTNGGGSTFIVRVLDSSNNILATTTAVSETTMENCATYASTTATVDDYTYFDFATPRTFVSGQSMVVSELGRGASNIGFYATTSTTGLIFSSRNCYGVNGTQMIGNCLSGFFTMPYMALNDSTSVNVNTRIVNTQNPDNGSLQPSTNVQFLFDYYFNDTEDFGAYDYVSVELTDLTLGYTVVLPKEYITASGLSTYDFTSELVEQHLYMWRPFIHSTGSSTPSIFGNNQTFDVVTYSGQFTPFPTPNSTSTITDLTLECSDDLISGSICKVFGYLFVPDASILDKFSNIWQRIKDKRPFGYVTKTIEQLESLDVSGSSAFTLGTVPFMDSVFTPFRTAISGILWALFAIYFYQRRLIHLDI